MNIAEHVYNLPDGDYAEVGVYQGDKARQIAAVMHPSATLWLFDPLCGHREPGQHDNADSHPQGRYADTSREQIFANMSTTAKVQLVVGYVPETLPIVADRKFRYVRIDCDHYEPTKAAVAFFKARLVPQGVLELDDFKCGDTPGATLAINEVLGEWIGHHWIAP